MLAHCVNPTAGDLAPVRESGVVVIVGPSLNLQPIAPFFSLCLVADPPPLFLGQIGISTWDPALVLLLFLRRLVDSVNFTYMKR
jgi:hypothetical protein